MLLTVLPKTEKGEESDGIRCSAPCLLFQKILEIALLSLSLPFDICFCTVTLISSEPSQG